MEKSPGGRNGRTEMVRALPPAEQQYQRHLIMIGERRRELAELERDLVALRDAVTGFEALAQARLGELFAELRRLEGATADYSHRVARLRAALDTRELDELDLDELDLEDEEDLLAGRPVWSLWRPRYTAWTSRTRGRAPLAGDRGGRSETAVHRPGKAAPSRSGPR